jgi:hypothetical protein
VGTGYCADCRAKAGHEESCPKVREPQPGNILSRVEMVLPPINDDIWEVFSETDLMTFNLNKSKPEWTQTAADIVGCLNIYGKRLKQ